MTPRPPMLLLAGLTLGAFLGCQHNVKVDPVDVRVQPIDITINLKIDRELDEFFDYEDELEPDSQRRPQGGDR